jgi:tRNA dimethylallyltransferase
MNKSLIVIVGPTGVGKSNLAIRVGRQFDGEIVNGDSRQIYRLMDIGTAKPSPDEMSLIPHHLFNIVDPADDYSLAQYQAAADAAIRSIWQRHKVPVLVGGSGQYILGLLEGWQVPRIPPNLELRKSLEQKAQADPAALYSQLAELDPPAAQQIDARNIRRVIRALEVCLQSGERFSSMRTKNPPDYRTLLIGLTMERLDLYRRTDARVVEMFQQGLIQEAENLLKMGYSENLPAMSSIGYRQAIQVLRQTLTTQEAMTLVQNETHRYIRHQYAWFRLKDPRIRWFDAGQEIWNDIQQSVRVFLNA